MWMRWLAIAARKVLKAQSIQWSPWLATGLGNDEKVQRGVRVYLEMGVRPLAVEGALQGLGRIMAFENKDALVLPVEWEQFGRSFENGEAPRAFVDLLPKKESAASAATAESIRDQLMDLEAGRRRTALEWHLQEKLAAVLKTDAARLDPAKPFGSMGVDSLMALEFVRRLSLTTGLRLPATAVFNYPTIHALASEISRRMEVPLDGPAGAASRPETREAPSPVADTSLTDEEAIEILAEKGNAPLDELFPERRSLGRPAGARRPPLPRGKTRFRNPGSRAGCNRRHRMPASGKCPFSGRLLARALARNRCGHRGASRSLVRRGVVRRRSDGSR